MTTKLESVHPSDRLGICSLFPEMSLRHPWDFMLNGMDWQETESLWLWIPCAQRHKKHAIFKNIKLLKSGASNENTTLIPQASLPPLFLCPPTAWMLIFNVWTWTWPARNGPAGLTRQVTLTQRMQQRSGAGTAVLLLIQETDLFISLNTTPWLDMNLMLLHELCKVQRAPTDLVVAVLIVSVLYISTYTLSYLNHLLTVTLREETRLMHS